ncbi:ferritin-like domain-containing protein [Mucilaginibacter segetis]|uniref:PA2169 family four-helix-bundle protein n=1 Tax=Mucilaginibacter segetis TaxID=2793071 RepID=A0A934PNX2_9SPHI|nr:PA2169 family four-helix-bundle protein [Mucilaginibacter segetis]MBK0378033.1 PA2169 family four-helix-bundle protein [Mucilaginibacter segetis]
METIEKSIEVLNDLIEINNDRIAGFNKAAKDLGEGDADLKAVFEKFANDSRENAKELSIAINRSGGDAETGVSASGTLHRAWLDVKATFTGADRKSILEECERGEDAIKKAYRDALSPDNGLSPYYSQLVVKQQQMINEGHDKIKMLRDSQL